MKVKESKRTKGLISIGVTWVDGRILVKPHKKQSQLYYGICHYPNAIWAVSPLDYQKTLMVMTIDMVPPGDKYLPHFCERNYMCLNFDCILNKFDKNAFVEEFEGSGLFSLGFPRDIGTKTLWFNTKEMRLKWERFAMKPEGGILMFSEEMYEKAQSKIIF